jgi:hypothetical protein
MPSSPTSHFHPNWDSARLQQKYSKHGGEVAELLSLIPTSYSKGSYSNDSKQTVQTTSLHFEGEVWEQERPKHPLSSYFVDGRMLMAITDPGVVKFVNFYPKRCGLTLSQYHNTQPGDRVMTVRSWLDKMENAKFYRKVRRRHGFD